MNLSKGMMNEKRKKAIAIMLLIAIMFSVFAPTQNNMAYAADDDLGVGTKVTLNHHHQIRYGTGDGAYSNLMKAVGIDDSLGDRYVFCTQPHMPTPSSGDYVIDKMYASDTGTSSMMRKLVYYAKGYPGWSKAKAMWFDESGFNDDDIYGIFHIAISYVASGYDDDMKAWGGGTVKQFMYKDNWNKMLEIVNDCKSDTKVPDPPKGFKCFYIIVEGCQNIVGGTLEDGELKLTKKSADTSMTSGNTCYSLEGAEFGVYKGDTKVATLITKADGTSNTVELEAGTYTVKELKVPKGYAKEPDQKVTVKAGVVNTVTFVDQPKDDPIGILLEKGDAETGKAKPQGGASLAGAVYEIKFYKHTDNGKSLARTWRVVTDKNGIARLTEGDLDPSFDNDEFYYSAAGDPCFPLGTVTIQEVKAPIGYMLNNKIYTREIKAGTGTTESVYSFNAPEIGSDVEVAEQVKRGDLEFVKVEDGTLNRLAGVPFKITSLTTGESHIIVTDRNGYASTASSWNKHTTNTNRGQTSSDGIWFGDSEPDNSKGALPYDDYMLEEQSCKANEGMNLLKFKVSIYKDAVTVPLGTLTDDKIEIGTTAKDEDTDSHIGQTQENVYIVDTVEYSGLKKGTEYKLVGTLMNQETGKAITVNGKAVTAEKVFTAKHTSGEVDVEFKVPGSAVKGKAVVVFEDLYLEDIKLATHSEIEDEGQTVYYPEIKTKAKDSETLVGVAKADDKITLVDTVSYSGLMPEKDYTVIGILMDKATGKPIMDGDKEVTAEADFVPKKTSGTVDVAFEFNGKYLEGKAVVVFETLKYHNREVAVHNDIKDDGQTVYFPEIGTTATDAETEIGIGKADENVTIIDTVSYESLRAGLEYKVTGVLMDKATGEAIKVNDKEVTSEATFIPDKSEGTVEVAFNFDATGLQGKSVVVFESLYYRDVELAVHADIKDDGQTIYFPEIGTTAKDVETNNHISKADENITIVDTVEYKNLRPGYEYRVSGVLMNKATGEPIKVDGKNVTAETVFTPETVNGSVEIVFNFNGVELEGKTVVAFESVSYKDIELAVHADLNDEEQTVYVPEIKTLAKDSETGVGVSKADDKITLIDTVSYNNLMPNAEYKVIGKLMDKATGEPVKVDDKEITAETVFTAETTDGTVDVVFEFDGKAIAGKTTVVFESLMFEDKEVAVHADIADDGQTVYFPEIGTTAKDSETNVAVSNPDETVTIVDTVRYEGLRPGLEYKVTGVLMDKASGKALVVDGSEVTAEAVFTPETANGTVDVTFKFNGAGLEGKTVVAFESVSYNGVEVGVHADINDKEQSIHFPEIGTTATDKADGDKTVYAEKKVTIKDTVKYKNLVVGERFVVKGYLVYKETGEPLMIKNKKVTAEKTFIATKTNGTVEVEFTFDARELEDHSLVVFEKLYHAESGIEVASHEDVNDEGQTVIVKKVPDNAPKTGDDSNMILWIMLLLASGTGIIAARVIARKREVAKSKDNE